MAFGLAAKPPARVDWAAASIRGNAPRDG